MLIVFPVKVCKHIELDPAGAWDLMTNVKCAYAPMLNRSKYEVFEQLFLHQYFVPCIKTMPPATIVMICEQLELFVTSAVETILELTDTEAGIMRDYGTIVKVVPRVLQPLACLNENFWEHVLETAEFFNTDEDTVPNPRLHAVSVAVADRPQVQRVLNDIGLAVASRHTIETPLAAITYGMAKLKDACGPKLDEQRTRLSAEDINALTNALRSLSVVQLGIGDTFGSTLESEIKKCTSAALTSAVIMTSQDIDTNTLEAASKLASEANVLWSLDAEFEFQKHQDSLADATRAKCSTQDKSAFEDDVTRLAAKTDAYTEDDAKNLVKKCERVDVEKQSDNMIKMSTAAAHYGISLALSLCTVFCHVLWPSCNACL